MKRLWISLGLGLMGSLGIVSITYLATDFDANPTIANITICDSRIC